MTQSNSPTPESFVHLRLHTEFSVVDGIVRVGDAVKAAVASKMPALAISDLGNLFGLIKFYGKCRGAGIKPIAAVDVWVESDRDDENPARVLLIVQNHKGYLQLCEILSRAYLQNHKRGKAIVRMEWFSEVGCDGLIALSGFQHGDIGQFLLAGRTEKAEFTAKRWMKLFPQRFYIELQRDGSPQADELTGLSCQFAAKVGLPVVATHPIQFMKTEDFRAHEARVCISEGGILSNPRRVRKFTEQQYFKSTDEMLQLFADIPSAVRNTLTIAQRCNLKLELGKPKLPDFPTPDGMTLDDFLRHLSKEGLEKRLVHLFPNPAEREKERPIYDARLKTECDTIISMGFPGYFLIVQDFINWGKNNGVPVGPGRGSGAGSLVAYALGITDIDPLRYDLLFERFLNPERVSMPDFDIDFCQDNRDRVIDYVKERYGRNAVSQIATFGTLGAKAVIRDAGRVLDMPYMYCDGLSKLIPQTPADPWDLDRAMKDEPTFRERVENEDEAKEIIAVARPLEGLTRNIGMHAGGVLIAPGKLTDFCPLYCAEGTDSVVSQYDKDDVEAVGLVKFDFLGLRNLTILDWAVRWVCEGYEDRRDFRLEDLPLDDPAVYRLFSEGNTTAVFQSESRSAKDLEKKLKPDNFEDIIALMALNRPGPLGSGMVDDFIARKKEQSQTGLGKKEWYFHSNLEATLRPTYGVIVYQEQVMLVAQLLAGYSLGGADLLRRAMGKKKPEEMAKQREIFTTGATERGVDPSLAKQLFDLMEKFAEYGFNKCLHGSTRVMDADTGRYWTVEELLKAKHRPRLHACDENQKLVPRRVLDVVWNGVKPVFKLTTRTGYELIATGNHPFKTLTGWTHLEDLRVGDFVASARELKVLGQQSWPAYQIITLAGLLSEGNTCHPSNLFFYNNDAALIEDFSVAAQGFGNTEARVSTYDGRRYEVCLKREKQLPWNHPQFAENRVSGARVWAESLGLTQVLAIDKSVPAVVFEWVDSNIELFLGRLWSGDGSLSVRHTSVFYATSSKQLADDVRRLMLRLGMTTTLHTKGFKYRDEIKPGYTVNLLGTDSLKRFVDRILPHVVGREDQVQALKEHASLDFDLSSKDVVPAGVRSLVDEARLAKGWTWAELEVKSDLSMREFCGQGSDHKKGFRRSTIGRLGEVLNSEQLQNLAYSDIFWDEVVNIEALGLSDTYDLEIEEHHNFVAEGLVVHNSHSAAYALIAYHTGWLKAHYPAEFMAASMSSDMDDTDKVKIFVEDALTMCQVPGKPRGTLLQMLAPDINESNFRFTPVKREGDKVASAIRYGLGAVKGTGQAACEAIVAERKANGPFTSLFDFTRRVDRKQINKRSVEALIRAGAFDVLDPDRAKLLASVGNAMSWAEQQAATASQVSLFGDDLGGDVAPDYVQVPGWTDREKLQQEKGALGYYFSGHLFTADEAKVRQFVRLKLKELRPSREMVWMAGVIASLRTMMTKRGKMAIILLDDSTAQVELSIFNEQFEANRNLLREDELLILQGKVSEDSYTGGLRVTAENLYSLAQARAHFVSRLSLHMNGQSDAAKLKLLLEPFKDAANGCLVEINYHNNDAACVAHLSEDWRVRPEEDLLEAARNWLGEKNARWVFQ